MSLKIIKNPDEEIVSEVPKAELEEGELSDDEITEMGDYDDSDEIQQIEPAPKPQKSINESTPSAKKDRNSSRQSSRQNSKQNKQSAKQSAKQNSNRQSTRQDNNYSRPSAPVRDANYERLRNSGQRVM